MHHYARAAAIALLLLTTGLAGCLGGSEDQPTTRPAPDGPETRADDQALTPTAGKANVSQADGEERRLTLQGCTEHLGIFPAPAALYASSVPEGLEPMSLDPAGATVGLVVIATSCGSLTYGAESSGPVNLLAGAVLVQPPDGLGGGADDHVVIVGGYTNDARLDQVLGSWGLDVDDGEASLSTDVDTPLVRAGRASASGGGPTVEMTTTVATAQAGQAGYHVRIFTTNHAGAVTGAVDWHAGNGTSATDGHGTLVITDGLPVLEGLAYHRWGPGYGYTLSPAVLPGDDPDA